MTPDEFDNWRRSQPAWVARLNEALQHSIHACIELNGDINVETFRAHLHSLGFDIEETSRRD